MDAQDHHLFSPKVVAMAHDNYIRPLRSFPDPANLMGVAPPQYGQDIAFGSLSGSPRDKSVGTTPAILIPKMRKLLDVFAKGDRSGMTRRLFDKFLARQRAVSYFDDLALNSSAATHMNIVHFTESALSAPNLPQRAHGRTRIHQALQNAGWDIQRLVAPADLGVPAFNLGSKAFTTKDFNNGLGLMINGVQHVYVLATSYHHDAKAGRYRITLKYLFYDVFGLDDDDLDEFGASSDSSFHSEAAIGITAWWQLQHQHGYAPLVTRIVVEKTFEAPAQ